VEHGIPVVLLVDARVALTRLSWSASAKHVENVLASARATARFVTVRFLRGQRPESSTALCIVGGQPRRVAGTNTLPENHVYLEVARGDSEVPTGSPCSCPAPTAGRQPEHLLRRRIYAALCAIIPRYFEAQFLARGQVSYNITRSLTTEPRAAQFRMCHAIAPRPPRAKLRSKNSLLLLEAQV
jgi:hypothetical protein